MFKEIRIDPDNDDDVALFVRKWDFLDERENAFAARRKRRTQFVIWLLGGVGIAVIGGGVQWLFNWLKITTP